MTSPERTPLNIDQEEQRLKLRFRVINRITGEGSR